MRFVVVHVHAVAVDVLAEAVAGPMQDVIPVAGAPQDGRGGAIDLPAAKLLAGRPPPAARAPTAASRAAHTASNALTCRSGGRAPGVSDPGDVRKDRAGTIELAPQVEQDQLVRLDRPVSRRRREVMRIPRVVRRRHVRGVIADQPLFAEPAGHLLLNVVFRRREAAGQPPADLVERAVLDSVQLLRRLAMRVDRPVVPDRGKSLHEIARRHHFDARLPDELDRAGVDSRDVGDRAIGRVLHRHAPQSRDEPPETFDELSAAGVPLGRSREVCERVALDGVDERARLRRLRESGSTSAGVARWPP